MIKYLYSAGAWYFLKKSFLSNVGHPVAILSNQKIFRWWTQSLSLHYNPVSI